VIKQAGLPVYHFTHVRHIRDILRKGYLYADSVMQQQGGVPVECGDLSVKAERRLRRIGVPPYGVPADYVPFYFAPRSPMLYKISKGGVPTYQDGQEPLVYLVTTVEAAANSGQPVIFSDGNCANAITRHFSDLSLLGSAVDWDVVRATIWKNTTSDGDRMRRRAAELLVHQELPVSAVQSLGTFDSGHAESVRLLLKAEGLGIPVNVRRGWYY
jgi:hypothetical protein